VRGHRAAAGNGLSRYPDGGGFRLKQALADRLGVAANRITLGNGSNDVLNLAARMALTPGSAGRHRRARLRGVFPGGDDLRRAPGAVPARDYGADLPAMQDAVDDDTAIVFLANPNNPTGTWVNEAALVAFLDALPDHVWMVLDEAYFEYVDAPGYPDGVALLERYPNLIVTRTFSKIHGLAGCGSAMRCRSPEAADLMNRVREPFNVNSLALAGAEAALADDGYVTESRRLNRAGMAAISGGLNRWAWRTSRPPATSSPSRCRRPGPGADAVYQALLREGVIVRPWPSTACPGTCGSPSGCPRRTPAFSTRCNRAGLMRLVVVGTGLIGGSFALAARAARPVRRHRRHRAGPGPAGRAPGPGAGGSDRATTCPTTPTPCCWRPQPHHRALGGAPGRIIPASSSIPAASKARCSTRCGPRAGTAAAPLRALSSAGRQRAERSRGRGCRPCSVTPR
jgi:histidinol-phosphate aminotransferase